MQPSSAPLPFASPPWLTPRRIALAAVLTFAFVAALPAVWWINDARRQMKGSAAMGAVVACTMFLSAILARWALNAKSNDRAALICAFGAIPLGVLNAGLSLSAVEIVTHGDPGSAIGGFFLGVLVGGFYGAPIGLVFGVAYAIVITSARFATMSPSHDSADRVTLTCSVWIALTGAVIFASGSQAPALAPPWVIMAAGSLLAALSGARLALRARWLRRVAEGRERAFRIEPESAVEASSASDLLPVLRPGPLLPDGIVTRRPPALGVAYRETPHWTPVALAYVPTAGNEHR